MTNLIVYTFASGLAFFVGAAALAVAAAVGLFARGRWGRSIGRGLLIAGLAFVWLSATPMPLWAAIALSSLAGVWLLAEVGRGRRGPRLLRVCSCVLVAFAGSCAVAELPHQLWPHLPQVGTRTIYVIGDSISGGVGIKNEVLWPADLGSLMPGRRVVNLAVAGATCATALTQARHVPKEDAYVLVEIGGNDLLGRAGPAAFRRDLQALLLRLSTGDRTLVMFELPLPPFYAAYGRIQRNLAARYGVTLIPKRYFARIITTPADTIDGLHLSAWGHEQMAETVRDLLTGN